MHLPTELPVIGNDDQSKTMKVFAFYSGLLHVLELCFVKILIKFPFEIFYLEFFFSKKEGVKNGVYIVLRGRSKEFLSCSKQLCTI